MIFNYSAINSSNTKTKDVIEAASREEAIKALQKQGLHVLSITSQKSGASKKPKFSLGLGKRVNSKEIVIFTRQLSTMISAGVAINRCLATLQEQAESPYFKQILGEISKDVQAGNPLGDSFAKYPNVFSDVYVNMVKAGEAGGILESILKRLATQVENDSSIKKRVKSAMTYPIAILTMTVAGFFGIMIFIMPKIGSILKDLGGENAELPVYTRAMLSISDFTQNNIVLIAVAMAIGLYLLKRYIRTPKGKYAFHAVLLKTPIVKTVITKVAVARFARTFSSLMSAGVNVLDALDVTGKAIGNKVIEKELEKAAQLVKNGKQLSETLANSPNFPPIVGRMLAVGEETGKMDEVLIKVADFYEEEVAAVIDSVSSLIEPIMIVVLGALVGVIAASVMGPIAGLSKNIQNN